MSQENVELVRGMFERIGSHGENPAALYEVLDDEVIWDGTALDLPGFGVGRGHQGVREWWDRWLDTWEQWEYRPERFVDAGDRVVVVVRQRVRGKGSGVQVDQGHAQVWTIRDGRAIRIDLHPTTQLALEAVGLSA
jgi:ketosteroid isomerase-like protein